LSPGWWLLILLLGAALNEFAQQIPSPPSVALDSVTPPFKITSGRL
jgi:hypothetical protein